MKEMVGGCCVCSEELGWSENPLVYCDGSACNVAVHQACYGIVQVPTGPWYCRKCETTERSARVRCELCPQKDGAFKKTDNGGWAHVVCALYIPEVEFGDVSTMEPIIISYIPPDRFNKVCYICEEKGGGNKNPIGACMHCNKPGCKQYFHVTCAQSNGLLCEEPGNYHGNVQYCGYCLYHYKKLKKDGTVKAIPAFQPIPADNATPNSTPEKPGFKSPSGNTINHITSVNSLQNTTASTAAGGTTNTLLNTTNTLPNIGHSVTHNAINTNIALAPIQKPTSPDPAFNPDKPQPKTTTGIIQPAKLDLKQTVVDSGGGKNFPESNFKMDSDVSVQQFVSGSNDGHQVALVNDSSLPSSVVAQSAPNSQKARPNLNEGEEKKKKARKPKEQTNAGRGRTSQEVKKKTNRKRDSATASKVLTSGLDRTPPSGASNIVSNGPTSMFSSSRATGDSASWMQPTGSPSSMEQLLERQWEQGSQFLMEQGQHFDIASLLGCLHQLRQENTRLEDHIRTLTSRRDHLLAVNARLSLPLTGAVSNVDSSSSVRINNLLLPDKAKETPPSSVATTPGAAKSPKGAESHNASNIISKPTNKNPKPGSRGGSRGAQMMTGQTVLAHNIPESNTQLTAAHNSVAPKVTAGQQETLTHVEAQSSPSPSTIKRPDSTSSNQSKSPQGPAPKKQRRTPTPKVSTTQQRPTNTSPIDLHQQLQLQQYQQHMMMAAQLTHDQQLIYAQLLQQQQLAAYGQQMSLPSVTYSSSMLPTTTESQAAKKHDKT